MENLEPRKFYKLPDRVFFWLNIVIIILSALAIIMLWVSNLTGFWGIAMSFSAFLACAILSWAIMGIIHPSKRNRVYAIIYFTMFGLHIVFWIITCFYERIPWTGAILETIIFTVILLYAIYIIVDPHISRSKESKDNSIKPVENKKLSIQQQNEKTMKQLLNEIKSDQTKEATPQINKTQQQVNQKSTTANNETKKDSIVNVTME